MHPPRRSAPPDDDDGRVFDGPARSDGRTQYRSGSSRPPLRQRHRRRATHRRDRDFDVCRLRLRDDTSTASCASARRRGDNGPPRRDRPEKSCFGVDLDDGMVTARPVELRAGCWLPTRIPGHRAQGSRGARLQIRGRRCHHRRRATPPRGPESTASRDPKASVSRAFSGSGWPASESGPRIVPAAHSPRRAAVTSRATGHPGRAARRLTRRALPRVSRIDPAVSLPACARQPLPWTAECRGVRRVGDGGGSSVCARMRAKLGPENGGRPASISYATIPSAY